MDEQDIRLDTATLRVLAHPIRLTVLNLLRDGGPATATRIAAELGINPGAASYHLRRLAAGGLIIEDEELGSGRDRWWKAAHRQSIHDPSAGPADQRAAGRSYTHALVLARIEQLRRAAQEVPLLPREWADVSTYGDFTLTLTPAEVARLRAELFDVIRRYRDEPATEGGAPVSVQVQAFPVPGTVPLDADPA
ncbi:ArsR/SmtB family transcription factor [Actinocatenispora comari]|jgi:DNA-binding transcriptional ArsR family regulator|uniref:Transcriptional regulator n=1 Tax=Actinocatenispora comari TaxID=2807577 RepID=A0A8J4AJW8_9ACTN|nr:winged helix-turn-helix domain-containing protein [Actinocatenispora comari]GIL30815.1 transcriptional regulator [Actinocatenispora comari]